MSATQSPVTMKKSTEMPDYEVFTYWHVFFLVGAILTYFIDLVLGKVKSPAASQDVGGPQECTLLISAFPFSDVVVSGTYIYDGYYWYGCINLSLVLVPTLLVQVFSVRWFQMDSMMKRCYWYIHASFMGVVHR